MIKVSIALVMAVIIINLFLQKNSGKRVPRSARRIFLRKAPEPRLENQRSNDVNKYVVQLSLEILSSPVLLVWFKHCLVSYVNQKIMLMIFKNKR